MTEQRSIELVDFALLGCHFNISPPPEEDAAEEVGEDGASTAEGDAQPSAGIEVEGALLSILTIEVDEEESEFVFVLETTVTDPASPYEFVVVTGSRFTIPEPPVSTDDAASTLLFISYPYVRELIFSLTSRSPFTGFSLPPLTRRPVWDPSRATE